MEREDINRITEELEDLLAGKRLPAGEAPAEKEEAGEASERASSRRVSGRGAAKGGRPYLSAPRSMTLEELEKELEAAVESEQRPEEAAADPDEGADPGRETTADSDREACEEQETVADLEQEAAAELETAMDRERESDPDPEPERRGPALALIHPGDGLIAAFVIPVVIMLIIFAQRGIFPFGDESFLRTDMYHQYAPFFSEFRHKLATGESLLYTWNVGMGVNFSALYAYYLASPLNWLLLLCPGKLVIEFMTYMIVLKIGLSGLTMAYYLRKHCGTEDAGVAFFGIFYALSGYMAAYSWNIMWLDCILLFPLIALGLERLVRGESGLLYGLTLGASILSNYYISIMTCIFMVLYFVALLVLEKEMSWEKFIGTSFRFAFFSLLAGGLAALVLLPEIYALRMTASGDFNFPRTFSQYFTIIDMFARHIGNVEIEIGLDHWPNIYCGVAVLLFFPLYLACREVSGKEKTVYFTLLVFFFASFSINVLNFIWHGFHYPNSLPCRQSYIYIFLLLLMCYQAYRHLKEYQWRTILMAFWIAVAFVLLAQKTVTAEHFHFVVFYVALLFLALYLGVIFLYRKGPRFYTRALFCAVAVVSVEAAVNTAVTSVTTTSRSTYLGDNDSVKKLVSMVLPARNGDTFFRMEKVTRKTKNDGAWLHFPSVSLFSSTANADLTKLFRRLGCESSTNAYSITGSTPLVDSLLAVEYGLYTGEPDPSGIREPVAYDDDIYLYRNLYTLPLGYWVPSYLETSWKLDQDNPADVQNSLAEAVGAEPVLLTVLDTHPDGRTVTFYPEVEGEYYAFVSSKKVEEVTVSTWKGNKTFDNVDRGYLLELGYCARDEAVTLRAEDSSEDLWVDIYRFSEEGLASVYQALDANPWRLTRWTDTRLEGSISTDKDGLMLTTIPYDKGWTIQVDGENTEARKTLGAFIGVPLKKGDHKITMSYEPEGMKLGLYVSLGSVILLAVVELAGWFFRRRERTYADEGPDEEEETA